MCSRKTVGRHEGKWDDSIFWWGWSLTDRFTILAMRRDHPILSHYGQSLPPIRSTMRSVLGLFTILILKRMWESISFQSNKFTACTVKDGKEVAKSFMLFNLYKILHPFQSKKCLKTTWNLSCNPQEYLIGYE